MKSQNQPNLRLLPAVERVLNLPQVAPLCTQYGRTTVTQWVREILSDLRRGRAGRLPADAAQIEAHVVHDLTEVADRAASQRLRQAINGTGIVIHTNLGRAPLAPAAIQAMTAAAACTNLEVDLSTGQRGRRGLAVEVLCQQLTGAEDALVVNNGAAATLLTLQALASSVAGTSTA